MAVTVNTIQLVYNTSLMPTAQHHDMFKSQHRPSLIITTIQLIMYLHTIQLFIVIDAQLTSPVEAVCPGNRVIFTCQQAGSLSRWMIYLPSIILQSAAQSSQNDGSTLTFDNDPGFHFELHVVSNSSNSIASELQVTAVSELNGVIVECGGLSGTFMSAIQVASVGELISIIII